MILLITCHDDKSRYGVKSKEFNKTAMQWLKNKNVKIDTEKRPLRRMASLDSKINFPLLFRYLHKR